MNSTANRSRTPAEVAHSLAAFQEWYGGVAAGGDTFDKFHYHLRNQLDGLQLSGKRILEVGCGKGAVSLYLALFSSCSHVFALDEAAGHGSPVGVTQTLRETVTSFEVSNINVVEADIMRNSFQDESFDLIIANNALHHVIDSGLISRSPNSRRGYLRLFGELKRLLAPQGILSISELSRLAIWRWSPMKLRMKTIDWELHPTRGEWLSVIRGAGLSVLSCDYTVPHPARQVKPLLTNPVAQFLLGPSFTIRAQK
ncbi:MAG: class I SAM-dependent methyltransferase [Chloroflexi bacterium]|nr:class I SAM-dependent methyltransferase [Chloroflexota bacterium]